MRAPLTHITQVSARCVPGMDEAFTGRGFSVVGAGLYIEIQLISGRDGEHEVRAPVGETPGRLGESNRPRASLSIHAVIGEYDPSARQPRFRHCASRLATHSPDFEHVAEIRAKFESNRQHHLVESEIGQPDALEQTPAIQATFSLQVDDTAWRCASADRRKRCPPGRPGSREQAAPAIACRIWISVSNFLHSDCQ